MVFSEPIIAHLDSIAITCPRFRFAGIPSSELSSLASHSIVDKAVTVFSDKSRQENVHNTLSPLPLLVQTI
jgi:hypothetical protein